MSDVHTHAPWKSYSRYGRSHKYELEELADWLRDQIDGGLECRWRDGTISRYIDVVESLAAEQPQAAQPSAQETVVNCIACGPDCTCSKCLRPKELAALKSEAWSRDVESNRVAQQNKHRKQRAHDEQPNTGESEGGAGTSPTTLMVKFEAHWRNKHPYAGDGCGWKEAGRRLYAQGHRDGAMECKAACDDNGKRYVGVAVAGIYEMASDDCAAACARIAGGTE